MQFIFTVENDLQRWDEHYNMDSITTLEQAEGYLRGQVETYNSRLRPNEDARRFVSVRSAEVHEQKVLQFIVYHEEADVEVLTGNVEQTLEYIRSYLIEAKDGGRETFAVRRNDLTQAEIDAAPEL